MTPIATRGIGVAATLHEALPAVAIVAFVGITQLGSVPFVAALSVGIYWFLDRRGGAFVVGVALGAVALTAALKAGFALPRPPPDWWHVPASGYGFPSGHATAAAATWGAVAHAVPLGSARRRWGVAAAVIGLVAVSRIALGVHFLADVIAGVGVGVAFLAAVAWVAGRRPGAALIAACAAGVAGAVATGGGTGALGMLGTALGATLAWTRTAVPDRPWGRGDVPHAVAGGVVAAASLGLIRWGGLGPIASGGLGLIAGATVIGLPAYAAGWRPSVLGGQ